MKNDPFLFSLSLFLSLSLLLVLFFPFRMFSIAWILVMLFWWLWLFYLFGVKVTFWAIDSKLELTILPFQIQRCLPGDGLEEHFVIQMVICLIIIKYVVYVALILFIFAKITSTLSSNFDTWRDLVHLSYCHSLATWFMMLKRHFCINCFLFNSTSFFHMKGKKES